MTQEQTHVGNKEKGISLKSMLEMVHERPITSWSCEGANSTSRYDYRREDCTCVLRSEIDRNRIFFSHIYTPYHGKNAKTPKDEYTIVCEEEVERKSFWVPLDSHGIRQRLVIPKNSIKELFRIHAAQDSQDYSTLESAFNLLLSEGRKIYAGWGKPSILFLPC